jgi:hypothetical protein
MMKAGRLDEIPPPRPKKRIPSAADKNKNTTTKSTSKRGGSRSSKLPTATAASINTHLDTYQLHTHLSSHSMESVDVAGNPLAALSLYMPDQHLPQQEQQQQQLFNNSFMIQQQYSTPPMTGAIPPPINTSFNFPQPGAQFGGDTRSLSQTLPSPMSLMASPFPLTPVFPQAVGVHQLQEVPEPQTSSLTILDGLSQQKTAGAVEAVEQTRTMASFIPSETDSSDEDSSDEEMSGMNPDYLSLASPDSPLGARQQQKEDDIVLVDGSAADNKSPFSVHAFQQLELSKMSHDDKTLLNSLVGNLADNLEDYISTLNNNNNIEHAFITTDASTEICV